MNKAVRRSIFALLASAVLSVTFVSFAQNGSQNGGSGGAGGGTGRGTGPNGQYGRGRGRSSEDDLPPAPSTAPTGPAPQLKPIAGEQFFIVASIDQTKQELLLKRPTEVTLLVKANDKTQYFDDSGRPLKLTDFRAGDTIWVSSGRSGSTEPTATRIRKGQMTVAELHKDYLDYSEIK